MVVSVGIKKTQHLLFHNITWEPPSSCSSLTRSVKGRESFEHLIFCGMSVEVRPQNLILHETNPVMFMKATRPGVIP